MSRMKHVLLSAVSVLIALPAISFADISVSNASTAYGTANMDMSPCSSIVGDAGIIKPKSTLTIVKAITDMYCGTKPCLAHVYLSKNCSGKKIADVTVHKDRGVIEIKNYSSDYALTGGGNTVVLNGKSQGGFWSWLLG